METLLRTYKNFDLLTDGVVFTVYDWERDHFQEFDSLEEATEYLDEIEQWDTLKSGGTTHLSKDYFDTLTGEDLGKLIVALQDCKKKKDAPANIQKRDGALEQVKAHYMKRIDEITESNKRAPRSFVELAEDFNKEYETFKVVFEYVENAYK